MFHMLTCFNLKQGVSMQEFEAALERFSSQMQEVGLVQSNLAMHTLRIVVSNVNLDSRLIIRKQLDSTGKDGDCK